MEWVDILFQVGFYFVIHDKSVTFQINAINFQIQLVEKFDRGVLPHWSSGYTPQLNKTNFQLTVIYDQLNFTLSPLNA